MKKICSNSYKFRYTFDFSIGGKRSPRDSPLVRFLLMQTIHSKKSVANKDAPMHVIVFSIPEDIDLCECVSLVELCTFIELSTSGRSDR